MGWRNNRKVVTDHYSNWHHINYANYLILTLTNKSFPNLNVTKPFLTLNHIVKVYRVSKTNSGIKRHQLRPCCIQTTPSGLELTAWTQCGQSCCVALCALLPVTRRAAHRTPPLLINSQLRVKADVWRGPSLYLRMINPPPVPHGGSARSLELIYLAQENRESEEAVLFLYTAAILHPGDASLSPWRGSGEHSSAHSSSWS